MLYLVEQPPYCDLLRLSPRLAVPLPRGGYGGTRRKIAFNFKAGPRKKTISALGKREAFSSPSHVLGNGLFFFTGKHSGHCCNSSHTHPLVSRPFISFYNCHPLLPSQDNIWFSRSDTFLISASCHTPLMFVLYPQRWWTPLTLKHTASCEKNPVFTLE